MACVCQKFRDHNPLQNFKVCVAVEVRQINNPSLLIGSKMATNFFLEVNFWTFDFLKGKKDEGLTQRCR